MEHAPFFVAGFAVLLIFALASCKRTEHMHASSQLLSLLGRGRVALILATVVSSTDAIVSGLEVGLNRRQSNVQSNATLIGDYNSVGVFRGPGMLPPQPLSALLLHVEPC